MKIQKLLFVAMTAAMFSCQTEDVSTSPETTETSSVSDLQIDKATIKKIKALHLNPDGVEKIELIQPDGTKKTLF